jgi:chromatin remodeling complex protein RSC6
MTNLNFISIKLANFLRVDEDIKLSLCDVVIKIRDYIYKNSLQDKKKNFKINPDLELINLLNLKEKDELTYFNLANYVEPLFQKIHKKQKKNIYKKSKIDIYEDSSDDEKSYAKIYPIEYL